MIEIIVMSVFCIVLIIYGTGVVLNQEWLNRLTKSQKSKSEDESSMQKARRIMGIASLVLGILGLLMNIAVAYVLIRGVSV
jgi:uncharacterized membrane protein